MLPAVHLLSAPGREAILAGTLASWAETDMPAPPAVFLDPIRDEPTVSLRIPAAWGAMLREALAASDAPHLLLLEDDLAFIRGLRAALLAWPPLVAGDIATFGSLYDPGLPARRPFGDPGATHFAAAPVHFYGAQALLLARPFAQWAAAHWEDHGGMQSRRLIVLAAAYAPGAAIPVHRPSLIEHTATLSAWGTRLHRARHFDPEWQPPL